MICLVVEGVVLAGVYMAGFDAGQRAPFNSSGAFNGPFNGAFNGHSKGLEVGP